MLTPGEQTAKESESDCRQVEQGDRTGLDSPVVEVVGCSSIANWVN
jgi:hypothetical protein